MEFGTREILIVLGIAVIFGILLDGFRRVRRSHSGSLKLGRRKQAIFDDEDGELPPDLPTGEVRVRQRDEQSVEQVSNNIRRYHERNTEKQTSVYRQRLDHNVVPFQEPGGEDGGRIEPDFAEAQFERGQEGVDDNHDAAFDDHPGGEPGDVDPIAEELQPEESEPEAFHPGGRSESDAPPPMEPVEPVAAEPVTPQQPEVSLSEFDIDESGDDSASSMAEPVSRERRDLADREAQASHGGKPPREESPLVASRDGEEPPARPQPFRAEREGAEPDHRRRPFWQEREEQREEQRQDHKEQRESTRERTRESAREGVDGSARSRQEDPSVVQSGGAQNGAGQSGPGQGSPGQSGARQKAPTQDDVIVFHIMARSGELFKGNELLDALLENDLRYGAMHIFHRHENRDGSGPVLFSLANSLNPGTFDLATMEDFTTPGVTLLMPLDGLANPLDAYRELVKTAQNLAKGLNGSVRDVTRSALTKQTIEHYRQQIIEYTRRSFTLTN